MDDEQPSYYAVIPANVRYDKTLKANEKLLYGEISALANKLGYCYASNSYFSKLYGVSTVSVSNWINDLKKHGYINIAYEKDESNNTKRIITIDDPLKKSLRGFKENFKGGIKENFKGGIKENFKHNNTRYNNTSINNDTSHEIDLNLDELFEKVLNDEIENDKNLEAQMNNKLNGR